VILSSPYGLGDDTKKAEARSRTPARFSLSAPLSGSAEVPDELRQPARGARIACKPRSYRECRLWTPVEVLRGAQSDHTSGADGVGCSERVRMTEYHDRQTMERLHQHLARADRELEAAQHFFDPETRDED
jgi:hypothetical protein